MTNLAQIFTGLLFYACVGIHLVTRLVFDNYQQRTFPLMHNVECRFRTTKKQGVPLRCCRYTGINRNQERSQGGIIKASLSC